MAETKAAGTGIVDCTEQKRLNEARETGTPWKKWGPYLSERQWGTVREDYSKDGNAWDYFTHDQSRSRAYRWGEDGLGGISDDKHSYMKYLYKYPQREFPYRDAGLGASHQTGWTGLVARLLDTFGRVTAADALETPKGKLEARVVRQQVGGE